MLKQRVENKHGDLFVGMDDKPITRADLEDPSRPGYLRPELTPIEPQVWTAAAFFGLRTPSGKQMAYVETKPDPREPTRQEAPADLRQRMETAQAALAGVVARIQAAVDERIEAEIEWRHAAARGDAEAYNRGLAREMAARRQQMDLEPEAAAPRKRLADCELELSEWTWIERNRRSAVSRS